MSLSSQYKAASLSSTHSTPCFFYGWVIVAVGVLSRGAKSWGQANVLLFVVPSIGADLALSSESMSLVFFMATLTGAALQVPIGALVDRVGARVCMTVALALLGAGMLFFTTIHGPIGLYFAFLALRASFAIDLFVDQCISQWFCEMRGRALAASNIGSQVLGGILSPEAAEWWTAAWGWRSCYVVAGAICLCTVLPVVVFVRRDPAVLGLQPDGKVPPGSSKEVDACESDTICAEDTEAGPVILGAVVGEEKPTLQKVCCVHEEQVCEAAGNFTLSQSWTRAEAFRTFGAWAFLFHGLADGFIGASTNFHRIGILSEAYGHTDEVPFDVAAWVNSPQAIANMITVLFAGVLIDRGFEPPRLLMLALFANILSIVAVTAHQPISLPQGFLHGLLQGINWGMSNTVKAAAYASYFGKDHIGSILGIDKFANIAGTSLGPIGLAALRSLTGSFASALCLSALMPLLAGILLCFVRRPQRRHVSGRSTYDNVVEDIQS